MLKGRMNSPVQTLLIVFLAAQSRFTNAELEAPAEATQAVDTQKLPNATDTASATLADTLRQLRANVDTRVAEHAAATAATTAAEGTQG